MRSEESPPSDEQTWGRMRWNGDLQDVGSCSYGCQCQMRSRTLTPSLVACRSISSHLRAFQSFLISSPRAIFPSEDPKVVD